MCDQATIDGIDSGKLKVVEAKRWRLNNIMVLWSPLVLVLGFIISSVIWVDDIQELIFDDHKQKSGITEWWERFKVTGYPFTEKLATEVSTHLEDDDLHMRKKDKDLEYVPRQELILIVSGLETKFDNAENEIKAARTDLKWIKEYLILRGVKLKGSKND